jgi:hypothetical protein
MSFIQTEQLALDTNEFIFAIRREPQYSFCEILLFDKLHELNIYLPLQVLIELQRNLTEAEIRSIFLSLNQAKTVNWDYNLAPRDLIDKWKKNGAKKGDAVIAAHLEFANIQYLVSENRHFLAEIPALPFAVLTSE